MVSLGEVDASLLSHPRTDRRSTFSCRIRPCIVARTAGETLQIGTVDLDGIDLGVATTYTYDDLNRLMSPSHVQLVRGFTGLLQCIRLFFGGAL